MAARGRQAKEFKETALAAKEDDHCEPCERRVRQVGIKVKAQVNGRDIKAACGGGLDYNRVNC